MTNPTAVEFVASPDHDTVSQTVPVVSRYDLEVYLTTGETPVKVQHLGKPTPDANGLIVYDQLEVLLVSIASADYVIKVAAVGPGGSSRSESSDAFTVTPLIPVPRPPGTPVIRTDDAELTVAQAITREAMASNSESAHPLPVLMLWNTGSHWDDPDADPQRSYSPTWQLRQIQAGHHIVPTFTQPDWTMLDPALDGNGSLRWPAYYRGAMQLAASLGLPVGFVGSQWESILYTDRAWLDLPYASNPNVADPATGAPRNAVSAFGAIPPWEAVGAKWMASMNQVAAPSMLSQIQAWYPNPPRVFWMSNNEAHIEHWSDSRDDPVSSDKHYLDLHGTGKSDAFKRQAVTNGWIARYRALFAAMRAALPSGAWRNGATFLGYDAFGPRHMGRWGLWANHSLAVPNQIDWNALAWDGGSPAYYNNLNGWDTEVLGPQYETQNYVFMLAEALAFNPDYWFELSTWNGGDFFPLATAQGTEALRLLAHDPDYMPSRYGGLVQYGMWLLRPRCVRPFMHGQSALTESQVFFDAAMAAVDRVYTQSTLQTFWRQSDLVQNTGRQHKYQDEIPPEYASVARSFQLTTSLDPNGGVPAQWAFDAKLPVFALARVRGTAPNRQWLVYAHSPAGPTSPTITLPGYGPVAMVSTVAGAFALVDEATHAVTEVAA